ncbi:MAG: four helix bundle protein [Chloroflexi bacterium]|nr:four helix bundle protein [Chloroflexota bacterium]
MRLLRPVHAITLRFPEYERFDLGSQMRRASKSICANIAEGYAKKRFVKEFRRYLSTAMGSAAEMEAHVEIARELSYISQDEHSALVSECQIIGRQLFRLIEKWRDLDSPTSHLSPPETTDAL